MNYKAELEEIINSKSNSSLDIELEGYNLNIQKITSDNPLYTDIKAKSDSIKRDKLLGGLIICELDKTSSFIIERTFDVILLISITSGTRFETTSSLVQGDSMVYISYKSIKDRIFEGIIYLTPAESRARANLSIQNITGIPARTIVKLLKNIVIILLEKYEKEKRKIEFSDIMYAVLLTPKQLGFSCKTWRNFEFE